MNTTKGTTSLDDIYRPLHTCGDVFFGILATRRAIDEWPIDIDPDFQRSHVWTPQQKEEFIGHLLEGGHVNSLIVNTGPNGDWPVAQMVDGKQRAQACLDWIDGKVKALLSDMRRIGIDDLDKASRTCCMLSIGLRYGMVRLTRAESLELYIRLNRGGTVHTDAEIDRVRELLAKEKPDA